MSNNILLLIAAICVLPLVVEGLLVPGLVPGLAPPPRRPVGYYDYPSTHHHHHHRGALLLSSSSRLASTTRTAADFSSSIEVDGLPFPLLRRISGVNWTGRCRYVGSNLKHVQNWKVFGGMRYDFENTRGGDGRPMTWCTLSSFSTFPNGKTKEVVMRGTVGTSTDENGGGGGGDDDVGDTIRLDTINGKGQIYILLTELQPDTILINEIDRISGNIILTSSLSLTVCGELIQIKHEVRNIAKDEQQRMRNEEAANASNNEFQYDIIEGHQKKVTPPLIEGHQVWRFKPPTKYCVKMY